MAQDVNIHISTSTIFKVLAIGVLLYCVYLVWHILLLLFVAVILATLIDPFASWFQQKKIPRSLAVLLIYIILFGIIGLAIALLAPIIAQDLPQLLQNMNSFWARLQAHEGWQRVFETTQGAVSHLLPLSGTEGAATGAVTQNVDSALASVFSTVTGFFGGLFSLGLVLVITFYMVVQEDPLKKILASLVPDEYVPYLSQLFKKIRDMLGFWLRAQLVLSLIVGVLVYIGLTLLGVKYAAVLALFAAVLEFIPYVGPVVAAIPALFLTLSQGGALPFFSVLIVYVVIQQLENHLLIPKIMQRAVGLNPIVSIVAILIGAQLAGVIGALLAIPVATALSVIIKDVLQRKKIS